MANKQTIYLSRHAQTYQNAHSPFGNLYDLTEHGVLQANRLGEYIRTLDVKHELLFLVSGEERTQVTLNIALKKAGLKITDENYFIEHTLNELVTVPFSKDSPESIRVEREFRQFCDNAFPKPVFAVLHGLVNYSLIRTYGDDLEEAMKQGEENCGMNRVEYDGIDMTIKNCFLPNWALLNAH